MLSPRALLGSGWTATMYLSNSESSLSSLVGVDLTPLFLARGHPDRLGEKMTAPLSFHHWPEPKNTKHHENINMHIYWESRQWQNERCYRDRTTRSPLNCMTSYLKHCRVCFVFVSCSCQMLWGLHDVWASGLLSDIRRFCKGKLWASPVRSRPMTTDWASLYTSDSSQHGI